MASYRNTPLYGGAITCDLPKHFADVRYAKLATHPRGAIASMTPYLY